MVETNRDIKPEHVQRLELEQNQNENKNIKATTLSC